MTMTSRYRGLLVEQSCIFSKTSTSRCCLPPRTLSYSFQPVLSVLQLLTPLGLVQAVDGERSNMVLVPRWDDTDNADTCIGHLVDALLQLVPCPPQDVRHFSRAVELQVSALLSLDITATQRSCRHRAGRHQEKTCIRMQLAKPDANLRSVLCTLVH